MSQLRMSVSSNGIIYAGAPPDGLARDLTQPYEAAGLTTTCVVTMTVAIVFVGIRLYTRYFITASVGADDGQSEPNADNASYSQ